MRKKAPRRVSESLPLSDFPGAELPQHRNERLKHEEGNEKIADWGTLRYFDTLSKDENGRAKADSLLKQYCKKSRRLKILGAFGDTRVRGGSIIAVRLYLGDSWLKSFMTVQKVTHFFKNNTHTMDLTLYL